jgi:hypothetical protein
MDVSLLPPNRNRIAVRVMKDPDAPSSGTFRLAKAPTLNHLPPGRYSLVGQAFLTGPRCPKVGCTGTIRQNRFAIR